jgi:hypothetical protein
MPSVVCIAQGPVIHDFQKWHGADLEVSSGRIIEIARQVGIRQRVKPNFAAENRLLTTEIGRALIQSQIGSPDPHIEHARRAVIRIDTIGMGSGPYDRLTHERWPTESFNAGSKAVGGEKEEARFANRRAQACSGLSLASLKVGDAFVVVEPHVPRPVGCENLPGLGDESWLGREHGDERSPRFSRLEVLLAHQSFVGQSAAD